VKAAAETTSLSNMKIGDKLEFLPRSNFSWKNSEGDTINYDSIELKLCAKDNFDEVSKDASKGFFYNIPEDSTYSDRVYWDQQGRYQAFVFRVEITGHVDKSFAGQMVNTVIQRTGETSPEYLYQGYVEDDGTFKVVFYQHNFDYGTYQFIEGKITESLDNPATWTKVLKRFDTELQDITFNVQDDHGYKVFYSDIDKNIILTLTGEDIFGRTFSKSQKLNDSNREQIFTDVPVSGKDGYVLTARGVPNSPGEKVLREKVSVLPGNVHDFIERYLSAAQFVDDRTCTITAQIEFADAEVAKKAERWMGLDIVLTGKDINGLERNYSATVHSDSTEVVFENVFLSGTDAYTIETSEKDGIYISSGQTVTVDKEGEKTIKVILASEKSTLKISVSTDDNATESFSVHITSKDNGYDKTYTTGTDGKLELSIPTGYYTVQLLNIPKQYTKYKEQIGIEVTKESPAEINFDLAGSYGKLNVTVSTEDNTYKGFTVLATNLDTGKAYKETTDIMGSVAFTVPTGTYNVTLTDVPERYDYQEAKGIEENINEGKTSIVNIKLSLKSE